MVEMGHIVHVIGDLGAPPYGYIRNGWHCCAVALKFLCKELIVLGCCATSHTGLTRAHWEHSGISSSLIQHC